jgi:hypothetical protein
VASGFFAWSGKVALAAGRLYNTSACPKGFYDCGNPVPTQPGNS